MTEYYLVDVKSITSNVPRSQFKVDDLERIAQSILAAGGLVSPVLLKQTGAETYEVLAGDLAYYAALRAKEIAPRQGEMVNAFVVSPKQQATAIAQAADFSKTQEMPIISDEKKSIQGLSEGSDLRLTNLESRLDSAFRDLKQSQERDVKRLEQELSEVKHQLPQKIEPLDAFNNFSISELAQKLAAANLRGKTAAKVIEAIEKERKKAKFTSFSDIVTRVNGLSEKRMLTILDTWGGMH